MNKIVLVGAGGHAKVIIDIIRSMGKYKIEGIVDKYPEMVGQTVCGVKVIGTDDSLQQIHASGVDYAFVCIGALDNMGLRENIFNSLKSIGYKMPCLVHSSAWVSEYAYLGEGTCVMPHVSINSGATIGENCIINTASVVEHDCIIERNVHISPSATLAGGVHVGSSSHIGIGACIIQNVVVGKNVVIGAGAAVINDIPDGALALGVPAKIITYR